jgi:hypothetical protein
VEVSPRVDAYIEKNFSPSEAGILRGELAALGGEVAEKGIEFLERIASAIIIVAERDFGLLGEAVALTRSDWRDVLSASGLQNADWRLRVDSLLGSPA